MTHDQTNDTLIISNNATPLPPEKPVTKKRPKRYVVEWPAEPYNTAHGETALWTAVITQAMMDALSRIRTVEAAHHKHEATCWLTGNSKDFVTVCLLAGMDPDHVRRKVKRTLVNPNAWRAAAGKGSRYAERKAYRQRLKKHMSAKEPPTPPAPAGQMVIVGPWH